jgi:hypothetical protein
MRRMKVIAAALLLALSAVALQSVALPTKALACTCLAPKPLAQFVKESPSWTLVSGVIGPRDGQLLRVEVEAIFHGEQLDDVIWLSGGFGDEAACDSRLLPGEHRFLAVYTSTWPFSTNICVPGALIDSPEGQALVAEAIAAFGEPQPPATPPPEPERPTDTDLSGLRGDGVVWLAVGLGAAALLFAGLGLAVRAHRRRLS